MRHTFLCLHHGDCAEECAVVVEREDVWMMERYRLVSHPTTCTCGESIINVEVSQEGLRIAYHLPESEEV